MLIDELRQALGEDAVLEGAALEGRHTADWSTAPAAPPRALLLPRTPQQVAQALAICNRHGQPIAVQGGLTGLAGGANPHEGEFALSLARLNRIEDIDPLGGTAIVQAGVTLEQLQQAAKEAGWFFPLDLGARGSCQVGGNTATNAGGNRVLRYGMMRQAVLGLEVALPDGTLLTMLDRVLKNNAGFDLKHLFIGSEGALGIVTRLALQLQPEPTSSITVMCAVPSFEAATLLLREARRQVPELAAFELMWHDYLDACAKANKKALPFTDAHPLYVLIETLGADRASGMAAVERLLESALEAGTVSDAIVAQSGEQAKQLWGFRDGVAELLMQLRPCTTFDVSVAMPQMDGLVQRLRAALEQRFPGKPHLFFGHLGDGNLHLVSGPYPQAADYHAVEDIVYEEIGRVGGSVSAEHGIGTVKMEYLPHSRDAAQIEVMRKLKRLFDPQRILNRDRVVDA